MWSKITSENHRKIYGNKKRRKDIDSFFIKVLLQQQVRSMVGCLKMIGEEKWNLDDLKNLFKLKKDLYVHHQLLRVDYISKKLLINRFNFF